MTFQHVSVEYKLNSEHDAKDLVQSLLKLKPKSKGKITRHLCNHDDDDRTGPCEVLESHAW